MRRNLLLILGLIALLPISIYGVLSQTGFIPRASESQPPPVSLHMEGSTSGRTQECTPLPQECLVTEWGQCVSNLGYDEPIGGWCPPPIPNASCGNQLCEAGEADDPGGCGPNADPGCLGPPARQGTCAQDCQAGNKCLNGARCNSGATCPAICTLSYPPQCQPGICPDPSISPTPICIEYPRCAYEGARGPDGQMVYCSIPPPPPGSQYCPRPTPTPTPTLPSSKISLITRDVTLTADDLLIVANGKKFYMKPDPGTTMSVGGNPVYPSNPNYTTLEAIWQEQGVEMRMFIYFNSDGKTWWATEARTYNAVPYNPNQNQFPDWIYYKGPFFQGTLLGNTFTATEFSFASPSRPRFYPSFLPDISFLPIWRAPNNVTFKNLKVQAFLRPVSGQCAGQPNGTDCTISDNCPVCKPDQPCPLIACPVQRGTCQNGQCVPGSTPSPTRIICPPPPPDCRGTIQPVYPQTATTFGGVTSSGVSCPTYRCIPTPTPSITPISSLPDLQVTNISKNIANTVSGQQLQVIVCNLGNGFTSQFNVNLYGPNTNTDRWSFSSQGYSTNYCAPVALSCSVMGNVCNWPSMTAIVDPENKIIESNENNNKYFTQFTQTPTPTPVPGFTGQYFTNRNLSGNPTLTRIDPKIDFDWKGGSPDIKIPQNNFSVRWTKSETFRSAGAYRFSTTSDDGVRVYLDGKLIINRWRDQSARTISADIELSAGNHTIIMEYYEHGGRAVAKLSWTKR